LDASGDGAEKPVFDRWDVEVVGTGELPRDRRRRTGFGAIRRSNCRVVGQAEQCLDPGVGVGAVVGEGLADQSREMRMRRPPTTGALSDCR
jgi:hypothetical protein